MKKIDSSLRSNFQRMMQESKESTALNVHKVKGSLWNKIPAIRSFTVTPMGNDDVLESFNIGGSKKAEIRIKLCQQKKMNRYMEYMVHRMSNKISTSPVTFWNIAYMLINRSISFRLSAINHVFKGW
jgi:hypothetical protein